MAMCRSKVWNHPPQFPYDLIVWSSKTNPYGSSGQARVKLGGLPEKFQELGRRTKGEELSVHETYMSTADLVVRRTDHTPQGLKDERYRWPSWSWKLIRALIILIPLTLPGCNLAERFSTIGEPPQLTQIKDPRDVPGYEPVHLPMPDATKLAERSSNSLWQTGSRAFFKDQRACKVGDVLTLEVNIDRKQNMQMSPDIEQTNSMATTVTEVMGQALPIQRRIARLLPGKQNNDAMNLSTSGVKPGTWASTSSNPIHKATATYDVQDKMQFNMAAIIIQILPNGNMVVQGREEVRLVNELREIEIKGIVRREDISSNNTVASQKIAQLRISYGGRGDLSDAQSAPWGQQYLNKLLPF